MDFTIEFGGDPQDVTATFSGVADLAGFERYNEELSSDPRFRTGMMILIDASELDTSRMSLESVQAASEPMIERDWTYPPLAIAIVAPDPRTFEDASQSRAHQGGSGSNRRVFRSLDAALSWLKEQRRSE